jgi:hypothetical protein
MTINKVPLPDQPTRSSIGIEQSQLPELVIPVIDQGGHGGIGHDDLNDPEQPLVLIAYVAPPFLAGDWCELFWGEGNVVQGFPITPEHFENRVIGFSVLPSLIVRPNEPIYTTEVYYRLYDSFSDTDVFSARRTVLVKNTVPGDPDPDNTTPYLNERLLAPVGVPATISVPINPVTLTIAPWAYIHNDDQLTVHWGKTGNTVTQPVGGLAQSQTVVIPAAIIEQGGDSTNLRVNYSIRDLAGNWSLYSEAAITNSEIDPTRPHAPRVLLNNRTVSQIDLDAPGPKVVTVAIAAYVTPEIALNDEITLHWAGETADGIPLVPTLPPLLVDDPGFPPIFDIPDDAVTGIANGFATVSYEVKPAAGGPLRTSRSVVVTVIREQIEQLAAPVFVGASGGAIDPEAVPADGASVQIAAYVGKQFGDIIYLLWEGTDSIGNPVVYADEHSVSRGEETSAFIFTVPKSEVDRLVNGSLKLSYHVKFFNGPDLGSQSVTYRVGGAVQLPKPNVDFAELDDSFDPDLHPTTTVRINGAAAALKTGDEVMIYWVGTPGAGSSTSDQLVGVANQNLNWPISSALVTANRDTTVRVRYTVTRQAGGSEQSEIRDLLIKTAAAATYPAPTVREAPTGVLDPMDVLGGAILNVAYDNMALEDVIAPFWNGQTLVEWQLGNASKSVDFLYPPSAIAASLGQTFDVSYAVRPGPEQLNSEVLRLTVSPLPDSELAKSRPVVTEAVDGVLDLNTFTGNAHVFVPIWPLAAVGQTVWLTVIGPNGVPTLKLLEAYQMTAMDVANGIGREIPRADLEQIVSMLAVTCKVGFDGGASEQNAHAFPIAIYTINDSAGPSITSVTDSKGQVANGATTFDTSITLAGKASPSQQVQILDGTTSKGNATVNANGDWTLVLTGLSVASHSITAKGLYGSNPVSGARTFTVQVAIPPLVIDTSPVTLSGQLYVPVGHDIEPLAWPTNTTTTRTATGGRPAYTYSSSNTAVAKVNSSGLVVARSNGSSVITVQDTSGQSAGYTVNVTAVIRCHFLGNLRYTVAVTTARDNGLRIPSLDELRLISSTYRARWPLGNADRNSWTSTAAAGINRRYCIIVRTGAENTADAGTGIATGYGDLIAI